MLLDKILPPAKIHMIGIGGISMSGLAEILKNKGYIITGSDINKTTITEKLETNGITIFYSHEGKNVQDCDAVIYTASIKEDNPEYIEAKSQNIPLIERCTLLGEISRMFNNSIAIAGTHGKTTTTSMISVAFLACSMDPTISVGGELPEINSNYKIGNSNYFITEACEYVESFLSLTPHCSIVLNIEEDHLDYFKDINHIKSAFNKFINKTDTTGFTIINNDDRNCTDLIPNSTLITFGIENNSNFMAKNITSQNGYTTFDLYHNNTMLSEITLAVPGKHNVYNALACIATCITYGLPIQKVALALKNFKGAKRRFEFKGRFNNIEIYDDYAHHPSEIKATLTAAKSKNPNNIWCIFQPHTYSRTKALLTEFSEAFYDANNVIITDIYAAREKDTGEISSKDLVEKINCTSKNAIYIKTFDDIIKYIKENARPGDLVFTIGAGNVFKIGEELINK